MKNSVPSMEVIGEVIDQKLTQNNKLIFNYFNEKFKEFNDQLDFKDQLKTWNHDLSEFSLKHRI